MEVDVSQWYRAHRPPFGGGFNISLKCRAENCVDQVVFGLYENPKPVCGMEARSPASNLQLPGLPLVIAVFCFIILAKEA